MAPPDDSHVLTRLQALLLNLNDVPAVLSELAGLAAAVVTTAPTSCGVTLRYQSDLLTVGSSDSRAEALDETQYRAGSGPCLESLRTSQIVDIPDLAAERRWPDYLAAAAERGLRCSLSLPLGVSGETFGAMNVYGFDQPQLFGEAERRRLELFAAQAAGTLQVAQRLVKDGDLLTQMEEALNSRTIIDQAMGIIMGQQRCTAETAFDLMRQQSQNSHRRLRDVAAALVAQTTGAPPQPGRTFDAS